MNELSRLYNPAKQIAAMRSRFPQFSAKRKAESVVFTGELMVKPDLPIYTVSVEYRMYGSPIVRVLKPELVSPCKHLYKDKVTGERSLCLYHSANFHWRNDRLVAKEIMEWTIAWIYFYEYWLQTGEWVGPEVPHEGSKSMIGNEVKENVKRKK